MFAKPNQISEDAKKVAALALCESLLTEPDPNIRANIARSLGRIGSEEAVATLAHALFQDLSPKVRANAARALEQIARAGRTPYIVTFIQLLIQVRKVSNRSQLTEDQIREIVPQVISRDPSRWDRLISVLQTEGEEIFSKVAPIPALILNTIRAWQNPPPR